MINRKTFVSPKSFLIALQVVVGITALAGGAKLVADPSGGSLGLSQQWLSQSPFPDFTLPGAVLFIVIGLGNVLASLLVLLGSRHAFSLAFLQGLFLLVFIAVEVWVVGLRVVLQPIYFILGLVQLLLAASTFRRSAARILEAV